MGKGKSLVMKKRRRRMTKISLIKVAKCLKTASQVQTVLNLANSK